MSRRERNLQDQEFSKNEKKVFGIIGIVCAVLMILVIVITVINESDSHTISRDYELSVDNVYEYITLDEIEKKNSNEEEFHVIIVLSNNKNTKTFMEIADKDAKNFELKTIYLLEAGALTKSEQTKLSSILDLKYDDVFGSNRIMSFPALVYFEDGNPIENCGLTDHPNNTQRIQEYFSNCGYTYED